MKYQKRIASILIAFSFFIACNSVETKNENKLKAEKTNDELVLLSEQIAGQPDNAELYYQRSQLFFKKNNTKQAFDDINKAVSLDSINVDYYLMLADVSFKGLRIQNAVDAFKKAIRINSKNIKAHLKLSELYLYIKAYPQCLAEASEALRIDKNIAKAYFIKGFAYKETGDTSKAISSFQTSVELQSDYYDAYIQLGNIEASRKHPIALQYYNNALRLQPTSKEALYNRGLLFQVMGEFEKADEDYYSILKIDNNYSDAHYNLGYIDLAFRKDYKSAVGHFTDAIRVNDKYTEAYYNRGVGYELMGDRRSAEKDFRHALSIFPDFKLAKDKLNRKD